MQVKRWLYRFRNAFELKNTKIAEEATSDDEEAAATYPTEVKLIKEKDMYA